MGGDANVRLLPIEVRRDYLSVGHVFAGDGCLSWLLFASVLFGLFCIPVVESGEIVNLPAGLDAGKKWGGELGEIESGGAKTGSWDG